MLNPRKRIEQLEKLVCFLARVTLAAEYGKDLSRAHPYAELILRALGNDDDIDQAMRFYNLSDDYD